MEKLIICSALASTSTEYSITVVNLIQLFVYENLAYSACLIQLYDYVASFVKRILITVMFYELQYCTDEFVVVSYGQAEFRRRST